MGQGTQTLPQSGTGEGYTKTTSDLASGGIHKVYLRQGQGRDTQRLHQTGTAEDTQRLTQTGTTEDTQRLPQTGTVEGYTRSTSDWDSGGIHKAYLRLRQRGDTQELSQTGTGEGYIRTTSGWDREGYTRYISD